MGGAAKHKGKQSGVWYDMYTIRWAISQNAKVGKSVAGELELLNAWLKYPDYRKADNQNLRDGCYADLSGIALQNLAGVEA